MFCPHCAAETTHGLNYCNRCGGNLAPLAQQQQQGALAQQQHGPRVLAPGAAWAAGLTTSGVVVCGLFLIFPITSELAIRGVGATALVWIALFVALAVVSCAAMLLRFWSLVLGVGGARASEAAGAGVAAATLPTAPAVDTRGLGEARFDSLNPPPVGSVTEQTTRTLEHAKRR